MFDAILYRYNDSVIDDHPLILTIVSKGSKVPEMTARYPKDYALLMAEGVIPMSLTWSADDKVVTIDYQAGQKIFSFKNHAYMDLPRGGLPWPIEIVLEREVEIPAKHKS